MGGGRDIDEWIEVVCKCQYLPENELKVSCVGVFLLKHTIVTGVTFFSTQKLCDYVCDLLLEESNVQPVSTPVTVCGDIHGQVSKFLNFVELLYSSCAVYIILNHGSVFSFTTSKSCSELEVKSLIHPMCLW